MMTSHYGGTFAVLLVGILAFLWASTLAMIQTPTIKNSIDWRPAKTNPTKSMKAISYAEHGGVNVLSYDTNYPRPIPRDGQVLIKVKASSVNPVDFKFRRNPIPSWILPKPKIPGADIAGDIVQVGTTTSSAGGTTAHSNLKVGDRVVAMMPLLGSRWGANAEYAAVDTTYVAKIPDNTTVDYESAASLPLVSLNGYSKFGKD